MRQGQAVWAATVIVVAGVVGIVALDLFAEKPGEGNLPLLIGFLAPTIAALLAATKANENTAALKSIDGRLNGDLDKRIEEAVWKALHQYHAATSEDCTDETCGGRRGIGRTTPAGT